ncbi:hypothetical protein ES706_03758 [subsurface metagenome]
MKCPKCGSTKIKSGLTSKGMTTWCEKCGHVIEQEEA